MGTSPTPTRRVASAPAFLPSAPEPGRTGRRGRIALFAGFVACASAIAVAAVVVKPTTAHSFQLLYGSVFVDDNISPVAIDLARGKPTVRLTNAVAAVSAASTGDLDVTALGEATLMLDTRTGEFNMLDASGLLVKPSGGGVQLPDTSAGRAMAVPAGPDAYILRTSSAGTDVYLVSQATVASAVSSPSRTVPRASLTLRQPLAAATGAAAAEGSDLWVLTGTGADHALQRLSVPAGSNAGVSLTSASISGVSGPSALESVSGTPSVPSTPGASGTATPANTIPAADTGSTTIAVASNSRLDLYRPDGSSAHLLHPPVAGLDQVLPVSNLAGRAAFLLHGTAGWNLLTAPVEGSLAQVHPLPGIPADATLIAPAASGGSLYVLRGDGDGELWAVQARTGATSTVPGAEHYPVLSGERLDLSGAEVVAEGSRVIVDSRANYEAEVIFTDGSGPPLTVDKHSAVQLDPSAAHALVVSHQAGAGADTGKNPPKTPPAKAKPAAAPTVNNRVDCRTSDQTPHIPLVRLVQRASRSVQLSWTYPLLDTQDCVPSTYTVAVTSLDSGSPAAPGTATVQGQDGVNLVGLFPNTDYRLVVTAYLNGRGTASAPLTVRTSAEGPAAPTSVTTTVDAAGNWTVTWQTCGGLTDTCVPSTSWQVIPSFCDGLGLSGTPQPMLSIGDPTQHTFSATYAGSAALLGRGLSFHVAGVGVTGIVGAQAGDKGCQYSWSPPVAADITLTASAPPATAEQSTSSTTVTASFAKGQTHDLGGVGGQLTYQLLTDGVIAAAIGPTTQSSVTFSGIHPGVHYQVRAVAAPARHPDAAVTVGPVDVQPALAFWPQPTFAASFADTGASTGTLTLTITLPDGTDTHGETFDLSGGSLDCGNAHLDLSYQNITAGTPITFTGIQRATYNSAGAPCSVSGALAQDPGTALSPPLYGAGLSPAATSPAVAIDVPSLDTSASDFSASWVSTSSPSAPQIAVSYTGSNALLATYAQDWTLTASTGSEADCGSSTASPAGSPAVITISQDCAAGNGSGNATWSVAISFSYFGAKANYSVPVTGTRPSPVDPAAMSFAAVWAANSKASDAEVQIQYSGPYDDNTLSSLHWSITITSSGSPGVTCASSTGYPRADGSGPNVGVDLNACPATTGSLVSTYTVHLAYTDPNYGGSGSYDVTVSGAAPK